MGDQLLARAIVEVGAKGVQDTTAKIAQLEAKLNRVQVAYNAGRMSVDKYLDRSQALQGQIDRLTGGLNSAIAAVNKFGSYSAAAGAMAQQAMAGVQTAGGNGAMGLMILSQSIDDIQYGFRAIVNNIPQLGMAFGSAFGMSTQAAMKFGAIAGIVGVAINTIINHWDELFQRFGYGTDTMKQTWIELVGETKDVAVDAVDTIQDRIKELEAKPIKMAVDMFELDLAKKKLDDLKEAREAWEQMGKGKGLFEGQAGSAVSDLFGGLQRDELNDLRTDMIKQRAGRMDAASPAVMRENLTEEEKRNIRMDERRVVDAKTGAISFRPADEAKEAAAIAAEAERRRQEAAKVRIANEKKAADELGAIYAKAASGVDPNARKQLADAVRGVGRDDLANRVADTAPAKLRPGFATAKEQQEQDALEAQGRKHLRDFEKKQKAKELAERQKQAGWEAEGNRHGREFDKKQREKQDQKDERTTAAMRGGSVERSLLANPQLSEEQLKAQIADAMKKAGVAADEIAKALPGVAKKIKKATDEEVAKRSFDRGINADQARQQLLKESQKEAVSERLKDAGGKTTGEFTSGAEAIYQKLQLTATADDVRKNLGIDIAQKQLVQAETSNKKLDTLTQAVVKNLANAKQGAATFGPKRG